jgi:site-specific recombinase XerD
MKQRTCLMSRTNRAVLEVLHSSGLRIGELVRLELSDIDAHPHHRDCRFRGVEPGRE